MDYKEFLKNNKIKVSNKKSKKILSKLIRKEFDMPNIKQKRAEKLIATAFCWNLECLESMIDDYKFETFEIC